MLQLICMCAMIAVSLLDRNADALKRIIIIPASDRHRQPYSSRTCWSALPRNRNNLIESAVLMSSDNNNNNNEPSSDKLVYDTKANRFYEAQLSDDNNNSLGEEFFLVDKATGETIMLTREEKERIFLDAIQSYYFSGKSNLPDDQFDRLREDLSWEGSALVTLNRNETLFINAMQAYTKGTPILSNQQFDELKNSLREAKSRIAVQTEPKCYVDTGVCKVTWTVDSIRTSSLYVPATSIATLLYLGVLYEIPFVRSNFNPLLILLVGAIPIYYSAKQITENFLFKDPLVAIGPCPNCGVDNKIFFGDVLGVSLGGTDELQQQQSTGKCVNCKTALTIKRGTLRVSTLPSVGATTTTASSE